MKHKIRCVSNKRILYPMIIVLMLLGWCTSYAAPSVTPQGLADNLLNSFRTLGGIISDFSVIVGILLFVSGLYHLKRYGEMRTFMSQQMTLSKPMTPIICGSLLIAFPTTLSSVMMAFWGSDWSTNLMSYQVNGDYDIMVPAIFALVRLIGIVSFLRGICAAASCIGPQSQPGSKSKVMMLIIAGILCVNVTGTVHLVNNIFHFSDQF